MRCRAGLLLLAALLAGEAFAQDGIGYSDSPFNLQGDGGRRIIPEVEGSLIFDMVQQASSMSGHVTYRIIGRFPADMILNVYTM